MRAELELVVLLISAPPLLPGAREVQTREGIALAVHVKHAAVLTVRVTPL